MTNIQLANTLINSGAYVDMQATGFTVGYKRRTRSEPVSGQNPTLTSDGEYDIAESDNLGIEVPIITLAGAISTEEYASNADLHDTTGITVVTLGYLKALWRIRGSSVTTLQIYFGLDNAKTLKNYNATSDTITVAVQGINLTPMQESEGNHIINYSIDFQEIKP